MGLSESLSNIAQTLLGRTVREEQAASRHRFASIDADGQIQELGGSVQPLLSTQSRWYLADLERAQQQADVGDLTRVGRLARSMRRDGMYSGLLGTRTSGLVSLPKTFRGDPELIADLTDRNSTRSKFDEMFPPSELALLAADGIVTGVGVAELVPVLGRPHPVMVRLEPEFLTYRYAEARWYYNSTYGPLPITPGDGRWILSTPGGRLNPWTFGQWPALGRGFIIKEHAINYRANYSAKLANPARVGYAPGGATESQRLGFLRRLMAWGINSVFAMPLGWEVKLLESNGRGHDVFSAEIANSDLEFMIALAGQVVTVTGGTGFANADIHQTIRSDLIKQTGDALSFAINTQGIPQYTLAMRGINALDQSPRYEYDTAPPEDQKTAAEAISATASAINDMNAALQPYGLKVDADEMIQRFKVPIVQGSAVAPEKERKLHAA